MPVYKTAKRNYYRVVIWDQGQAREWKISGSKGDALAFEARTRAELETAPARLRVVPTFSSFCVTRYKTHAEQQLAKRSWSNRQYVLRTLALTLGSLRLTDITRAKVEDYQGVRLKQGISPGTINDEITVLKNVLNYARAISVPAHDLKIPKLRTSGKRRVTFWTSEQVARLLRAAFVLDPELAPIIVFLLNTGCRRGESIALKWSSVDLERNLISFEPSKDWQPKNGKARDVPISDALLPFLSGPRRHPVYVFPSRAGGRFVGWPQKRFDRVRKAAGLTGGPHTSRHTFATHFLKSNPDLYLLARLLGHSNITVTRLYSHLLPEHLEQARNAVNFASPIGPAALEAKLRWNADPVQNHGGDHGKVKKGKR